MPLTKTQARSKVAEMLAVLSENKGFDYWWQGWSTEEQDDISENLTAVLMGED